MNSPGACSGSLLVASTSTPGQPASTCATRCPQAASRCSQLSSTISSALEPQLVDQRLAPVRPGARFQAERLGHHVRHQQRLADGDEIDEPHAVRVLRADPLGDLHRQPGLAAAAGSGEGEQPRAPEQPLRFGEFPFPADEAGHRGRQVSGRRSAALRAVRGCVLLWSGGRAGQQFAEHRGGLLVGVRAECLQQVGAQPLVPGQRLRAAAARSQQRHQRADRTLVHGIRLEDPGQQQQGLVGGPGRRRPTPA